MHRIILGDSFPILLDFSCFLDFFLFFLHLFLWNLSHCHNACASIGHDNSCAKWRDNFGKVCLCGLYVIYNAWAYQEQTSCVDHKDRNDMWPTAAFAYSLPYWRRREMLKMVENGRNSNFQGLVTLTLTLDPAIRHTSCITQRPLPIYQISFKLKKLFVDGRTYKTDGRTNIFPLRLLDRLLEVLSISTRIPNINFLARVVSEIERASQWSHSIPRVLFPNSL